MPITTRMQIVESTTLDLVMKRVLNEPLFQGFVRRACTTRGNPTVEATFDVSGYGDGTYVALRGRGKAFEVEIGGGYIEEEGLAAGSRAIPLYKDIVECAIKAAANFQKKA